MSATQTQRGTSLSNDHKLLLQGFVARGILKSKEVYELLENVRKTNNSKLNSCTSVRVFLCVFF